MLVRSKVKSQGKHALRPKAGRNNDTTMQKAQINHMRKTRTNNRNIQITLSPFSPGSPGFPGTPWNKQTHALENDSPGTYLAALH